MTNRVPHLEKPLGLFQEFRAFLDKYGVIGLAIAFVIGAALTQLVQAIVKGLLIPLITPILPAGDWRTAEATLGPFRQILWGEVLYSAIYFLVIAVFVFVVAKLVLREKEVSKK